ncbi:MAG: sodium/proline symporter PutP [Clostridiales bacterium]|nr:sodium/proline symporter PutP [Clostridiales bacterium]
MSGDQIQILVAMCIYLAAVIGIGIYYMKTASKSSDNYFIGGRKLGPWIAAMSAEASDMSGWLLMGLPGVAYWFGLSDAIWTAIGLALGTYLNWLFVAKRLRRYSTLAGNSITIPEFLSNRFKENKRIIQTIASLFILVFFTVYAASCFVTFGKLFSTLFGMQYQTVMIIGAAIVILYTYLGGFLAESASDFLQGIVMIVALCLVLIVGVVVAGGIPAVVDNIKSIPGFFDFFGIAQPQVVDGVQQLDAAGNPLFGPAGQYGLLTIISTMSWGLGYFGMPQVLLRFMAINKSSEIKKSRRIAIIWCVIALLAAVAIGLIGRTLYPAELLTRSGAENIFITMSTGLLPAFLAGIVMSGILAATMSSSDSYLLIASSALSRDIFKGIFKKNATDRQVMIVSRITLLLIAVFGIIIALDENSVIFKVVSFAWAGFGATFGPIMLFSLFWKRTTRAGAIAGMVTGGAMVFIWNMVISKLGGVFAIYELFPAFVLSCIAIVIVSLLTRKPDQAIMGEFETAKTYEC